MQVLLQGVPEYWGISKEYAKKTNVHFNEPWSQLIDPILRQRAFHKLVDVLRPVTKSREPVFDLVSKLKA